MMAVGFMVCVGRACVVCVRDGESGANADSVGCACQFVPRMSCCHNSLHCFQYLFIIKYEMTPALSALCVPVV